MNLNPKVRNSTLASALSVLILFVLSEYANVNLGAPESGAIVVIVTALVGYLTSQGSWAPKNNS